MSISQRAQRGVCQENILRECFGKVFQNPFDPENNPDGIINMGTSENKLCMEILHEKLAKLNLDEFPTSRHHYCDMRGTPEFRKALASFLDRYMKPKKPMNMENIFVFNGCGSVIEMLGFTFCDDGEGMLVPAPYYGAFKTDLMCRMGVVAHSVDLSSSPNKDFGETSPFELSVARLENAYDKAKSKGITIRCLILSNPNNPLGNVYTKSQLIDYLKFANRHSLHVILDEIYMLSIHDTRVSMTTGLSLDDVIDPNLLHVVWGFSKDFGVSGFRCGLVHTENKEVSQVLTSNAYFQALPTVAQYVIQSLVSDFDWLDNVYIPTNLQRLSEAYMLISKELSDIGVEILPSSAGLYVWVDLRKHTKPLSRDGEMMLMGLFLSNGVYITPGVAFNSTEYGWFRIIISVLPEDLKLGIKRIKTVLNKIQEIKETKTGQDLDTLVCTLQQQIKDSNWLKDNSAEKWTKENPQLAEKFSEAKQ